MIGCIVICLWKTIEDTDFVSDVDEDIYAYGDTGRATAGKDISEEGENGTTVVIGVTL